jgi:hypothetical protein
MKHPYITRFTLYFLLISFFCCGTFYAQAQTTDAAAATPKTIAVKGAASYVDGFFKRYKEEGSGPAVDYLFATNKLFTDAAQLLILKNKLDSLQISVGKYIGKELISQKSASPSFVLYSYLVKFENQPFRFIFVFYKPHNDWELYRFNFDDQLESELEEAAKLTTKKPL